MDKEEIIYLGGGCFWCIEAVFTRIDGVATVESGYMGGLAPNPTYKEVCTGTSGYIEVVKITFNPQIINFTKILEIFFSAQDPTTFDRQGGDVGPQYRSIIFYVFDQQKKIAEKLISKIQPAYPKRIVTSIKPAEKFYLAEEYHQDYFDRNKTQPYCAFVISPKLKSLKLL